MLHDRKITLEDGPVREDYYSVYLTRLRDRLRESLRERLRERLRDRLRERLRTLFFSENGFAWNFLLFPSSFVNDIYVSWICLFASPPRKIFTRTVLRIIKLPKEYKYIRIAVDSSSYYSHHTRSSPEDAQSPKLDLHLTFESQRVYLSQYSKRIDHSFASRMSHFLFQSSHM